VERGRRRSTELLGTSRLYPFLLGGGKKEGRKGRSCRERKKEAKPAFLRQEEKTQSLRLREGGGKTFTYLIIILHIIYPTFTTKRRRGAHYFRSRSKKKRGGSSALLHSPLLSDRGGGGERCSRRGRRKGARWLSRCCTKERRLKGREARGGLAHCRFRGRREVGR